MKTKRFVPSKDPDEEYSDVALGPPASVVLTLWLSSTPAEGLAARPLHDQMVVQPLQNACLEVSRTRITSTNRS